MSRLNGVKGVVAVNSVDVKAMFSSYGRSATLSAPGVNIWVAYPNRSLSRASGTSYASAMAASRTPSRRRQRSVRLTVAVALISAATAGVLAALR